MWLGRGGREQTGQRWWFLCWQKEDRGEWLPLSFQSLESTQMTAQSGCRGTSVVSIDRTQREEQCSGHACDPRRPTVPTLRSGAPFGLKALWQPIEILNNFSFAFVVCKWNPMGPWSLCHGLGTWVQAQPYLLLPSHWILGHQLALLPRTAAALTWGGLGMWRLGHAPCIPRHRVVPGDLYLPCWYPCAQGSWC